jgi:hypothetical protein
MITAEHYQELIMNFISLLEVGEQDYWLQQDGTTVHTANSTMQMLGEIFGGRIISRKFWHPRSPDLSPTNFYLWGGFDGGGVQKPPAHFKRTEKKILNCALQTSLQKPFTGLHQT